jgi:hypothetical protein
MLLHFCDGGVATDNSPALRSMSWVEARDKKRLLRITPYIAPYVTADE